jgi:glycosyltransferase involved in cell wall biosynthesis
VPETYKRSVLKKSMVIPNGIDEFWFDNLAQERDLKKPLDIRLVQTGDINRNKNIETTVEAGSILMEKGFNVRLDVVGKIRDENVFAKIKKYDFVNYLGFRSKQELLEIYRNNDVFVLPSVTETFGLVYPEAMSQGLPVIYSKGQGFDGQFKEGEVGYGVNSFDASEIANRIIDILSDYNSISANVRTKINKFTWDSISDQYIYLYHSI